MKSWIELTLGLCLALETAAIAGEYFPDRCEPTRRNDCRQLSDRLLETDTFNAKYLRDRQSLIQSLCTGGARDPLACLLRQPLLPAAEAAKAFTPQQFAELRTDCLRGKRGAACVGVAYAVANGFGVARGTQGVQLGFLDKGCDDGSARACDFGGTLVGKQNDAQAFSFHRRACYLGDPEGCLLAGDAYTSGKGTRSQDTRALESYLIGCNLGDTSSCDAFDKAFSAFQRRHPRADDSDEAAVEEIPTAVLQAARGVVSLSTPVAAGSGVLLRDGIIATANHVVELPPGDPDHTPQLAKLEITQDLKTLSVMPMIPWRRSAFCDLAIFRPPVSEYVRKRWLSAVFRDPVAIHPGEIVYGIGKQSGISAFRVMEADPAAPIFTGLGLEAGRGIESGDSGGAVVDREGKLVGVLAAVNAFRKNSLTIAVRADYLQDLMAGKPLPDWYPDKVRGSSANFLWAVKASVDTYGSSSEDRDRFLREAESDGLADPQLWLELASHFSNGSHRDIAERYFLKYAQQAGDDASLYRNWAVNQPKSVRLRDLEYVTYLEPGWGIARADLGFALEETGEYERAIAEYRRALDLLYSRHEPYPDVYRGIVRSQTALKQFDAARKTLQAMSRDDIRPSHELADWVDQQEWEATASTRGRAPAASARPAGWSIFPAALHRLVAWWFLWILLPLGAAALVEMQARRLPDSSLFLQESGAEVFRYPRLFFPFRASRSSVAYRVPSADVRQKIRSRLLLRWRVGLIAIGFTIAFAIACLAVGRVSSLEGVLFLIAVPVVTTVTVLGVLDHAVRWRTVKGLERATAGGAVVTSRWAAIVRRSAAVIFLGQAVVVLCLLLEAPAYAIIDPLLTVIYFGLVGLFWSWDVGPRRAWDFLKATFTAAPGRGFSEEDRRDLAGRAIGAAHVLVFLRCVSGLARDWDLEFYFQLIAVPAITVYSWALCLAVLLPHATGDWRYFQRISHTRVRWWPVLTRTAILVALAVPCLWLAKHADGRIATPIPLLTFLGMGYLVLAIAHFHFGASGTVAGFVSALGGEPALGFSRADRDRFLADFPRWVACAGQIAILFLVLRWIHDGRAAYRQWRSDIAAPVVLGLALVAITAGPLRKWIGEALRHVSTLTPSLVVAILAAVTFTASRVQWSVDPADPRSRVPIQVDAVQDSGQTEREVARYRSIGLRPYSRQLTDSLGQTFSAIYIGGYRDAAEAKQKAESYVALGWLWNYALADRERQ